MGGTYGNYFYYRQPPTVEESVHIASLSPTLDALGNAPLNGLVHSNLYATDYSNSEVQN